MANKKRKVETSKKLKKQLKKLEIRSQSDLINLMIGVVSRRISVTDIEIRNWIEKEIDGLTLNYRRMDESVIELLSEYDLSQFVSEADSFLNDIRRTETGSFYTPIQWVRYMIITSLASLVSGVVEIEEHTAVSYIMDWMNGSGVNSNDVGKEALEALSKAIYNIKVVDIACGAGAFLIQLVDLLTSVFVQIEAGLGREHDSMAVARHFLAHSVYGIDLQSEPLAVYTLCLLWKYADSKVWQLKPAIVCGNSIGDSIFDESPMLHDVIASGGFDIAIGNPPYLGEKGNTAVFKEIKNTEFGKKHYEGKMDLSYFFTLKSLDVLKDTGRLIYLTTNYFITADGAVKYRKSLNEAAWFSHVLNFNTYPVFKEALGQHNMIFMLKKKSNQASGKTMVRYVLNDAQSDGIELSASDILSGLTNDGYINEYSCDAESFFKEDGIISILSDDSHKSALEAYEAFCDIKLKDVFNINQGIVSGADQVSGLMLRSKIPKKDIRKHNMEKGDPIFVFGGDDPKLSELESEPMRPFYKNSDIGAYMVKPRTHRTIIYIDDYMDEIDVKYPKLLAHLSKYKPVLDARREVKTGTRPWYGLQWPRKPQVFEGDKIVVPQRCKINRFAYTDMPFYCSADVYFFKEKLVKSAHAPQEPFNSRSWHYYLGILNSSILYLWLYHNGKRKGELLELYAKPLLETSVPAYRNVRWQNHVSELVGQILDGDTGVDIEACRREIDAIIFEAMNLDKESVDIIREFHSRHTII